MTTSILSYAKCSTLLCFSPKMVRFVSSQYDGNIVDLLSFDNRHMLRRLVCRGLENNILSDLDYDEALNWHGTLPRGFGKQRIFFASDTLQREVLNEYYNRRLTSSRTL